MVVLTIVTQKNGETTDIFFDEPIPKVHFIKLLSCSLYNSWDMLKNESEILIVESDNSLKSLEFMPGHYTLETLAKKMVDSFKEHKYEISADTYSRLGQLVIKNHRRKPIRFDRDLANLLDISREPKHFVMFIKRIITRTAYFIHCDLIDRNNNLFNGKESDLLAKFGVKGNLMKKSAMLLLRSSLFVTVRQILM